MCCCFAKVTCLVLQNGVLLRTVLDLVTGDLSDTRTRYENGLSIVSKQFRTERKYF